MSFFMSMYIDGIIDAESVSDNNSSPSASIYYLIYNISCISRNDSRVNIKIIIINVNIIIPLRIQVCPNKRINPYNPVVGMGFNHHSYSWEGFGFLGSLHPFIHSFTLPFFLNTPPSIP